MCLIESFSNNPAAHAKTWRRVRHSGWFMGILLTISKRQKGDSGLPLLEQSPSTGYPVLPTCASPEAVQSHEHSIEIPKEDEEGLPFCPAACRSPDTICKIPSLRLTHRGHYHSIPKDLRAPAEDDPFPPLLDQRSASFPASKASPRQISAKNQAETIRKFQCTIQVEEEEESESRDDAAVRLAQEQQQLNPDTICLMVKKKNLSLLRRSGGVRNVASVLNSDLEIGLSIPDCPDTQPSILTAPTPVRPKGYLFFLWRACKDRIIMIFLTAAALSFLNGFMAQGFKDGWHDGAAIVVAIFLLVTVSSASSFYQAKELEKKQSEKILVSVIRGGHDQMVEISKVKQGDVVKLGQGSIVPGDGLIFNGFNLVLDHILNPEINQDHNPFLSFGSRVTSGTGTMLVTSTADENALLVKELSGLDPPRPSLLEARVNWPHNHLEILALTVPLLVLFQALVRKLLHKEFGVSGEKPELMGKVSVKQVVHLLTKILLSPRGMIPVLTSSLALMVIGLQHGVPLVISLTLAHWNPADLSAKIQNLWACTTMGISTVLYINDTCGLISYKMEVAEVWIGGRLIPSDEEYPETPSVLESLHQAIVVAARVPEISACPRNSMLIRWADSKWDLTNKFMKGEYAILDCKLRSDKNGRGTLMRKEKPAGEGRVLLHWKGAASSILEMCSHYINKAGNRCSLEEQKEKLKQEIRDMEERGLVAIAFAARDMNVQDIAEEGLDLLAIVGLKLIISDETKSAASNLSRMGICIWLVSEDDPSTLRSVAHKLKVGVPDQGEGKPMNEIIVKCLKPDENQKHLQDLKRRGEVIAFCGGLTSDVPTMKEADLAITVKDKGTQMAKEIASLVLDKGITSLVPILKLGRRAYSNIQFFTRVQLVTWISWFVLTLIVAVCSGDSPATPLQQIWVNAIMCLLGGLMMRMELRLPTPRPNRRTEALIEKAMWINIVVKVSCQLFVFLLFQFKGRDILGVGKGVHEAMMFTSFTLCQVLDWVKATNTGTGGDRSCHSWFWEILRQHCWFWVTVVAIVAMQVVMVQFMQSLANGHPLNGVQWILSCGIAILPLVLHQAVSMARDFLPSVESILYLPWSSRQTLMVVIPFSVILLVSASQTIHPIGIRTFR